MLREEKKTCKCEHLQKLKTYSDYLILTYKDSFYKWLYVHMYYTRTTRLGNLAFRSSNLHSLRTADARQVPFLLAGL